MRRDTALALKFLVVIKDGHYYAISFYDYKDTNFNLSAKLQFREFHTTEDGDIDASVEANWVTITSVNATAITFTVDENPDTDERSTAITVTYTYDGGKTIDARIEITQEARIPDPEMTISEPEVHVSADGGESKVAVVITNPAQDGSINATTDASWITITSVNETSVAFTTSENTETSERNATITVTYTYGGGKTIDAGITVTQEAAQSSSQYDYDYILVAYSGYKAGSNFYATFADKEYTSVGEPNTTYYKLDLYSDNSTNSDLTAGTYTLSESTGAPMTFSKKYSNGASYNEYRDYAWNVKFAEGTINISYEGDNMIMEGFMTDESGKTHHILYNGVSLNGRPVKSKKTAVTACLQ